MNVTVRYIEPKLPQYIHVKNRTCKVCGVKFRYRAGEMVNYPDNNACYDCQFWMDQWQIRDEVTTVRVNGNHYIVGEEEASIKGMSGAKVRIKFMDGREVMTDNLWHQGEIPEVWRDFGLEDNAEFGEVLR